MENNFKKELEKLVEDVNKNFSGKMMCGCTPGDEPLLEIYEEGKYIEFIGPFKYKAKSMKELKPIFDFIQEKGYKTNLD